MIPRMITWLLACFATMGTSARAATNFPAVQMLVPGFTVQELPVRLNNVNNLRFAPDGSLTALGYDGRIWRLTDSDGDGLEDSAKPFWSRSTLSVPVGMAWSTRGLYVSSKGKLSLLRDNDGDGEADTEDVVASGWPTTDVASGGVDASSVTLDREGNAYFALLVADYSNAYRLRKRRDLRPQEKAWLVQQGKAAEGNPDEEVSLYDIRSQRGTIQKWDARTKKLETIATGMRVPYTLAFNRAGDLFNTDQEGETWMPYGNPVDELNHIVAGKNYGFPPRHPKWLPDVASEAPVVGFGPQHQSTCGLVFNEPRGALNPTASSDATAIALPSGPSQGLFGPKWWDGDAFVAGESRGQIWRVKMVKTPTGYVGHKFTIARLQMLTLDFAISPKGDLYVCCHSGKPDWGTGPKGEGKIFRIRYSDPSTPQPTGAWANTSTEVRIGFDRPVDESLAMRAKAEGRIEFGDYVSAGDQFETLKPPYAVVKQQDAIPRGRLTIRAAKVSEDRREVVLTTDAHPVRTEYVVTIPGTTPLSIGYNLTAGSNPQFLAASAASVEAFHTIAAWAPTNRPSSGTSSRPKAIAGADWERGSALFHGPKTQCATCHRVRGKGAVVGPDLSNLVHRDAESILRDIRSPDATLHPDYIAYEAELTDDTSLIGFVREQTDTAVRLVDAQGKETPVQRSTIRNLHPTGRSLMPAGLIDALAPGEVNDLLTYLMHEPPVRTRADVEGILKAAGGSTPGTDRPKIVLVASKQDHGALQHDYPRWQTNWHKLLSPHAVVTNAWLWPTDEQFASAKVVVFYYWNRAWDDAKYAQLDAYLARGGGVVVLHSGTIEDKDPEKLAARIGLAAHPKRTKYIHAPFDLSLAPAKDQPLTAGLPRKIPLIDEPYWPMIGDRSKVDVLATVRMDKADQPVVWTHRPGPGRVWATCLGHYSWTLDDPFFRVLVLRGIAWAGGMDKPDSLLAPDTLFATQ